MGRRVERDEEEVVDLRQPQAQHPVQRKLAVPLRHTPGCQSLRWQGMVRGVSRLTMLATPTMTLSLHLRALHSDARSRAAATRASIVEGVSRGCCLEPGWAGELAMGEGWDVKGWG